MSTIEDIRNKYCADRFGGVMLTRNGPNLPESAKKMFQKQDFARNNKEYQAAKRKWLQEMDKYLDARISGKNVTMPPMPRVEDFIKK